MLHVNGVARVVLAEQGGCGVCFHVTSSAEFGLRFFALSTFRVVGAEPNTGWPLMTGKCRTNPVGVWREVHGEGRSIGVC